MTNRLFQNRPNRLLYVHDGAGNFIVAYIFQMILQLLFTLILMATMPKEDIDAFNGSNAYIYIIGIINELAFAITPLSYSKVLGQNYYKDMGFKKKISVFQVLMLILLTITLIVAIGPIADFIVQGLLNSGFDATSILSLKVNSSLSLVLGIIFLAIVPGIVEEILFRGMIARAFSRKSFIFAIFMCGLLFGIMHGNPIQLVHQMFLGALCSIVYFATGSIYAPIIIHITNNIVAVVGSYILYLHPIAIPSYASILMIVLGLIALVIFIYLFMKMSIKGFSLKGGVKSIEGYFERSFVSDEERAIQEEKAILVREKAKEMGLDEMNEVYIQTKEAMSSDEKVKARTSMLLAYGLAIAVFVINTILGYV